MPANYPKESSLSGQLLTVLKDLLISRQRFEMPFNIWCLSCDRHIARGVRFNAEKRTVGKYLSTPIYGFRMKCPSCSGWMEIHTDPANSEYQVKSGARRKAEEWNAESIGIEQPGLTDAERQQMASNPFMRLEHQSKDRKQLVLAVPRLQERVGRSLALWRDDFASSSLARQKFRQERAQIGERRSREASLKERLCLGDLQLAPELAEDVAASKKVTFTKPIESVSQDIFNRSVRHSSRLAAKLQTLQPRSASLLSDLELQSTKPKKR